MEIPDFPAFVKNLPAADLPVDGIKGWLLLSNNGQVLFLETSQKVQIPEHSHGDQWGIVVEGEMELTIADKTETYRQGDSYFIPGGTVHRAILYAGFRALDFFADKNRYQVKVD
jgi:hypothetical protein